MSEGNAEDSYDILKELGGFANDSWESDSEYDCIVEFLHCAIEDSVAISETSVGVTEDVDSLVEDFILEDLFTARGCLCHKKVSGIVFNIIPPRSKNVLFKPKLLFNQTMKYG